MSPNNVRAHGKFSRHRHRIKTLSYVFFLSWYQMGKINPNSVYFWAQKWWREFWRCLSFISSSICKHYLRWNVLVDGWRWRWRIKGPFSRDNEGWGQRRLETGVCPHCQPPRHQRLYSWLPLLEAVPNQSSNIRGVSAALWPEASLGGCRMNNGQC